jgi:hypothetical protein
MVLTFLSKNHPVLLILSLVLLILSRTGAKQLAVSTIPELSTRLQDVTM